MTDPMLVRLDAGQVGDRVWVDPAYHRLGYHRAPAAVLLRPAVFEMVEQAAQWLQPDGLGLLLWDGGRSRELQRELWNE